MELDFVNNYSEKDAVVYSSLDFIITKAHVNLSATSEFLNDYSILDNNCDLNEQIQ
jgi:hypothetical protein